MRANAAFFTFRHISGGRNGRFLCFAFHVRLRNDGNSGNRANVLSRSTA
jgi:hypothetical protein